MKGRLGSFKREWKGDIKEELRWVCGECLLHRELGRTRERQIGWRTSLTCLAESSCPVPHSSTTGKMSLNPANPEHSLSTISRKESTVLSLNMH